MKAITVRQPWAECIARGTKTVENRTRPCNYRGPLAIHAGLGWSEHGGHSPLVAATLTTDRLTITRRHAVDTLGIAMGAVIAVADLADCHPDADGCCGLWAEYDVHHLVLANVRRLAVSVPARGALGLWEFDESAVSA